MRRLVLGIAVAVTALMPAVSMADDQQIADYIKSRLQVEQQRGNLRGFNVDMRVDRGTVWFKGFVSNSQQEMSILRTAQQAGHLGVVQVVDDIDVRGAQTNAMQGNTAQVAYQQQMQQQQQAHAQQAYQQQMMQAYQQQQQQQPLPYQAATYQQPNNQPPMPNMMPKAPMHVGGAINGNSPLAFASSSNQVASPASAPMAAGGMEMGTESPNLPGYSWPGYAPHPNYAALSYPQQYSPQAWPYIGPFYPYPQVPLGWRKVSLEWDDGWWQLDFHDK